MRITVFENSKDFDRYFEDSSELIELVGVTAESKYAAADAALAEQIDQLCFSAFGERHEVMYHQNYDWWPNKTRYLNLTRVAVSPFVLRELAKLLYGEFETWRIVIMVHDSLSAIEFGGMLVYSERIVVEKAVLERCGTTDDWRTITASD